MKLLLNQGKIGTLSKEVKGGGQKVSKQDGKTK